MDVKSGVREVLRLVRRQGRWLSCVAAALPLYLSPCASVAQISPGPLARAHAEFDGTANCTRCHAVKPGSANFRCLDCHKEIAVRLQQRRGYHAAIIPSGAPTNDCVRCHSDHNGENFALIHWDIRSFDHSKTGYLLEGKHANVACAKCHNAEKIPSIERINIQRRDLNRSYLGLSRACGTCHEDKHRGQLGQNCASCHNLNDWKVAREFDHAKTKYPLTGAHANVNCQKCHTPGENGAIRYVGLKFERCADCHNDVHHGSFQQSCETCHKTLGWKKTPTLIKFDHSTTKYPLNGKHTDVACETCHHGADFKRTIVFKVCRDCHNPDPHGNQFAKRADGGACESCHDVNGFKPSLFKLADHNHAPFPLRGKHADVQCAKCHEPAGKATRYMVRFDQCLVCHKDVHAGQFAKAPYLNRCEECHDENSFHRTAMTLARHQQLNFKLTGGHIAVACIDCHKPAVEKGPVLYHFDGLSCTTCHNDTHRGEFDPRMKNAAGRIPPEGCTVCHSTESWKKLAGFHHEQTDFALDGAHRAVACSECHRPPNMERSMKNVNFKSAPKQCEQCHEDVHGAQFVRTGTKMTRCAECHNATKWRPSTFDHEKTKFSLKGPHQDVRCKACHINVVRTEGKPVLVYKPTPIACSSCHAGDLKLTGLAEQSRQGVRDAE